MRSTKPVLIATALLICAGVVSAQMPQPGKPAPSFTVKNHEGKDTTFPPKGSWAVLAFYPKAATPG